MTGFGRAESENGEYKFTVEINSVNNRYLDYQMRFPKSLASLENEIKLVLNNRFNRGKIMVSIVWESEQSHENIVLDEAKADAYYEIFKLIKDRYSLDGGISMRDFASLPDLVKAEKKEDDLDEIWRVLKSALEKAADAVVEMRRTEGKNLADDMSARLTGIGQVSAEISDLASGNVEAYREKLKSRIQDILGDTPVDEHRLATEVTIFAEKSDITEECIRLSSHIEQCRDSLKEDGPIGKRLNFILQELNREANTIGSKSASYEISRRVIAVKEELERLREQVQNIE